VDLSLVRVIHILLPVVFEGTRKYITIELVVFRKYILLHNIKAVMLRGKNSTALKSGKFLPCACVNNVAF